MRGAFDRRAADHTRLRKGRRIRAAVVDQAIQGPDPFTPEEFAKEYQVALAAVLEALEYVDQNRPLIEQGRDHVAARLCLRGLLGPTPECDY